jgi:hypothetical protein
MAKVQNQRVAVAEQQQDDSFSIAEGVRAGLGSGAFLGVVLGGTFWTHTPDVIHFAIAVIIVLVCAAVGGLIGWFVAAAAPAAHE